MQVTTNTVNLLMHVRRPAAATRHISRRHAATPTGLPPGLLFPPPHSLSPVRSVLTAGCGLISSASLFLCCSSPSSLPTSTTIHPPSSSLSPNHCHIHLRRQRAPRRSVHSPVGHPAPIRPAGSEALRTVQHRPNVSHAIVPLAGPAQLTRNRQPRSSSGRRLHRLPSTEHDVTCRFGIASRPIQPLLLRFTATWWAALPGHLRNPLPAGVGALPGGRSALWRRLSDA